MYTSLLEYMTPLSPFLFLLMACNDTEKNIGIINSPPNNHHLTLFWRRTSRIYRHDICGAAGDADNSPDELLEMDHR